MMYLVFLFSLISISFADTEFKLSAIHVDCPASLECEQRTFRFKGLVGEYRSLLHLKETLRVMASDGGYQSFYYSLNEEKEVFSLDIRFSLKPTISKISVIYSGSKGEFDASQLLDLREGEFFEAQKLDESVDFVKKRLDSMGYPDNKASFEFKESDNSVELKLLVSLGSPRIFKSINSDTTSPYVKEYLKRKFLNLYNKPFDLNRFKVYMDEAQKELFSYGYYLIGLDFNPVYKKNRVILDIKVTADQLFAFDFKKLEKEHRDVVHRQVIDLFKKYKRTISESVLKNSLKDHYQHKALLNADLRVEISHFTNKDKEKVQLYRIFFDEKNKTRLRRVSFSGNSFYSTGDLERMFEKEAFELASLKYYDEDYFSYFQEYLKTQYIENGFVQVKVLDPVKSIDSARKESTVDYAIFEGPRTLVRKIEFDGLPTNFEDNILSKLSNKVANPFNPISLVEDIKKVALILQEEGYYYAEVSNSNDSDLVHYSKSGADVDIKFKVVSGPIVKLNRVLFLGNEKTKKKVLAKKISLQVGDIITPMKTREIESAISATGLFNSVTVTPLKHTSKNAATDLLVKVSERDYGLIELAPGYRTDLGIKLTGTISYLNIGGYNRAVTLQSQLNQRLNYSTLDPERRKKVSSLLEHNTTLTYNQGDIFDTLVNGAASIGYQRRRFYTFDADIMRLNGTLTRDLTSKISTSLTYQYEDISQYNATQTRDDGTFQIGAITPSLTYDLRNSQINPLRGAYFNMSCEFANPYFLSQKQPDLTVNYYKLISRNRFYLPFKNGTLALSLVGGMQENLAKNEVVVDGVSQTNGYIPNIKVFRLTGMDIVRGYTDQEMNRLPNGKDVSSVRVDNKAFLANFKVEPRYFINDALMTGIFYDAGHVSVDGFNFSELRDSVGVSFKVLTPVGTLDFDYGIKLLRKRDANGTLESPGRFHVSIGFF